MGEGNIFECIYAGSISKCATIVKGGGVIVFPTDTVYGIGCDPYNHNAVIRVFTIKCRERTKPLPILASNIEDVKNIALLDSRASLLTRRYWPGRLTLVCPTMDARISSLVVSSSRTVAVRIPNNKCTLDLLKECRYLVGTSANVSGKAPIKGIHQLIQSPLVRIDAILDGGYIANGNESTIVDLSKQGPPNIVREGAIKSEDIRETLY